MPWVKKADHQGWENYETWTVNLLLSNEQGTYNMVREKAREFIKAEEEGEGKEPKFVLADWLKDWVEENKPEMSNGMYAQLLTGAIGAVNFDEIADHWIEDEIENIKREQPPEGKKEASAKRTGWVKKARRPRKMGWVRKADSSWETGEVDMWLSNDEGLYNDVEKQAERIASGDDPEVSASELATWLEQYVTELLTEAPGAMGELTVDSLKKVDFEEIALPIMEEAEAQYKEDNMIEDAPVVAAPAGAPLSDDAAGPTHITPTPQQAPGEPK